MEKREGKFWGITTMFYFKVPLFKCRWIDSKIGVETDELGFTRVDLRKATYKNEPFIMEN